MYEASLLGAPARPDTSKWKLAAAFLLGAGLTALLGRLVPLTTNTAIAWDWTYRRERGLDPFNRRDEELSTPHKLMVDGGSTPVELQMSRGTCWIFAAMSVLEWSYRDHGVKRGWLQPDEYLRMSEQAFGVSVLDACHALPERKSCMIGAQEWRGSQLLPMDTQGGDVELLAYFKSLESAGVLPWSICPYTPKTGHDRDCPGLHDAIRTNPLTFNVRSLRSYFEPRAIKAALAASGRLMSFSSSMVEVKYLLPCTHAMADALGCDPQDEDKCKTCPSERAYAGVDCCVESGRESSNMNGEFFRLPAGDYPEPPMEGGHAMGLVGYTDVYQSRHGFVGGWILKNSWFDGLPPGWEGDKPSGWKHARGSHSIAYFMQKVSQSDEMLTCPNSASPQSWSPCGSLKECRSEKTAVYAAASKQPLRLTCIDKSPFLKHFCERDEPLFLTSITPWKGGGSHGLHIACFLRDQGPTPEDDGKDAKIINRRLAEDDGEDEDDDEAAEPFCSPPVPIDDLALAITPVEEERYPNDPDVCGHYFFPYTMARDINAAFGGFEVSDFDIAWDESAYAANAYRHSHLNYTLLARDTHKQGTVRKSHPYLLKREDWAEVEDRY